METKNESEKVFEQYLDSNGFEGKWTYEPSITGKSKHPDYLLDWDGKKCFFEVKELRKKANEPTERTAYIDPYSSLRTEIDEARKKFKEFKEYSCSLVVYNIDDRQFRSRPLDVFSAMLGNLGITMDFDCAQGKAVDGSERNAFLEGGKMINKKWRQPQNTTISAIVVLDWFRDNRNVQKALREEIKKQEREVTLLEKIGLRMRLYEHYPVVSVPRVTVVENPFARVALPMGLLEGPFDERWRIDNNELERVFAGSKLKEWESLKCHS